MLWCVNGGVVSCASASKRQLPPIALASMTCCSTFWTGVGAAGRDGGRDGIFLTLRWSWYSVPYSAQNVIYKFRQSTESFGATTTREQCSTELLVTWVLAGDNCVRHSFLESVNTLGSKHDII